MLIIDTIVIYEQLNYIQARSWFNKIRYWSSTTPMR
jgi:hypothetical protein